MKDKKLNKNQLYLVASMDRHYYIMTGTKSFKVSSDRAYAEYKKLGGKKKLGRV